MADIKETKSARLAPPIEETSLIAKSIQQAIASNDIVGGSIQRDVTIFHEGVSAKANIVVFDTAEAAERYSSKTAYGIKQMGELPTLPDGRPYLIFRVETDNTTGQEKKQSTVIASHVKIITNPGMYGSIREKFIQRREAQDLYSGVDKPSSTDSGQKGEPVPGAAKFKASAKDFLGDAPGEAEEAMATFVSMTQHKTVKAGDKSFAIAAADDLEATMAHYEGSADDLAEKAGYVRVSIANERIWSSVADPEFKVTIGEREFRNWSLPLLPGDTGDYYFPKEYVEELGIELEA